MTTIPFNRKRLQFKKEVVTRMLGIVETRCHNAIDTVEVKDPMVLIKQILDTMTLKKEPANGRQEQDNIPRCRGSATISGCSEPHPMEQGPEGEGN